MANVTNPCNLACEPGFVFREGVTTNGTILLKDFGSDLTYVISLDGPREVNDRVRGNGTFDRVMKTVAAIPDGFRPTVMTQCVLRREEQGPVGLGMGLRRSGLSTRLRGRVGVSP